MKSYFKKCILFVTLISAFAGILYAQGNGMIRGMVIDAQTGEPLPGANVVIKEFFLGTASKLDGEFVLSNVPAGTRTVSITYLGHQDKEVVVEVSAGETATIEVEMNIMAIQGEEVVVTAQIHGQRAAINQQLASNTVTNVISSEKMKELPDANAAEAIGRLPGVSLKRNAGEADQDRDPWFVAKIQQCDH